jgi:hypothetical protein
VLLDHVLDVRHGLPLLVDVIDKLARLHLGVAGRDAGLLEEILCLSDGIHLLSCFRRSEWVESFIWVPSCSIVVGYLQEQIFVHLDQRGKRENAYFIYPVDLLWFDAVGSSPDWTASISDDMTVDAEKISAALTSSDRISFACADTG